MEINYNALYKLGYGLYVVTSFDGDKDNGFICNTVVQVSDNPKMVAISINKQNYSHDLIKLSGILNVNCLTVDAPFSVFERFGFQSGISTDKFKGIKILKTENNRAMLTEYINACISLKVENTIDLGSHTMFICSITESEVINDNESMTYAYYHKNVKPKKQAELKKGWVCKICGYIYDGEELPLDFICPTCKHPASDFEKIK